MHRTKRNIAVLPHTIDSLCIDWNAVQQWEPWFAVEENSLEEQWAVSFLPAERILRYVTESDTSPEALLTTSTLPDVLKRAGVDALLFTDSMTPALVAWADRHALTMVVTPYALQERFEDKIWFDGFMTRHSIPKPQGSVCTFPDAAKQCRFPCVIQGGKSRGGEETFIVESEDALIPLLDGTLRANTPYLVREFVEGVSHGITILVTGNTVALSVPCVQCFYPGHTSPLRFAGIQFVDTASLNTELLQNMEHLFLSLGRVLHADGFRGYANFDFIITPSGECRVLECNPRFTATSVHHNLFPELFSGLPSGALFLDDFVTEPTSSTPKDYGIPRISCTGSLLFGYADSRKQKMRESGIYVTDSSGVHFVSPDPLELPTRKGGFFLYAEALTGTVDPLLITDTVFSSTPLFDPNGSLSGHGLQVLSFL